MLVSLFILLFITALVLTILGALRYEDHEGLSDLVFWGFSFGIFMILFAQALYIEVPYISSTDATTYTVGTQQYMELGISMLCLGFALIDLIIIVIMVLDWREGKRGIAVQ